MSLKLVASGGQRVLTKPNDGCIMQSIGIGKSKRKETTMNVEQYRMATGYYDEGAIMQAGGVDERSARFADIFGDVQGPAELSPEYQALLDEARRRNAALHAAADQATEQEAAALVAQPEPWSRETWKRLVKLQYATAHTEDGGEQGSMSTSYALTERGQQLLDPSYRDPGTYDDQAGIDG